MVIIINPLSLNDFVQKCSVYLLSWGFNTLYLTGFGYWFSVLPKNQDKFLIDISPPFRPALLYHFLLKNSAITPKCKVKFLLCLGNFRTNFCLNLSRIFNGVHLFLGCPVVIVLFSTTHAVQSIWGPVVGSSA